MDFAAKVKKFPKTKLYDAFRIGFNLTTEYYIETSIKTKIKSPKERIKYRKECEEFMEELKKEQPYTYILLSSYANSGHATVYDLELQLKKFI